MRRITLAAVGIYLMTTAAFAQAVTDTSAYKNKKLKVDEVNLVSSYYTQNGNNSAVTGGMGTEKLTDFATAIDVKLSRYDLADRKHTITAEVGVDAYTSASSDNIDPSTISGPSSHDTRIYPSLTYAVTNEKKGSTVSVNGSLSTEYDYFSKGASLGWAKLSKDRNREFTVKGQAFLDTWTVILPAELRQNGRREDGSKPRNSYSASFTLSQVTSRRIQILLLADIAYQQGQLATLYQRVYFTDGSHKAENLPSTRYKLPLGLRFNYFAGDRFIFRTYYRYYADNWGLSAHTAEMEIPVKITPFFSISPFYRYVTQKGMQYFSGYEKHAVQETYFSSDFDLSTLTSEMMGVGLRYSPPGGILGQSKFNALEVRFGHYHRSTGLNSSILTMLLKFK